MMRAISTLFGSFNPVSGTALSAAETQSEKVKKSVRSKKNSGVVYNVDYVEPSTSVAKKPTSPRTPAGARAAPTAAPPSSRRVHFSGRRDVRHYDLTSPPSFRHPVDTTNVKISEVKKHLDFIVSSRFQNTRLKLERLGARIFSIAELENALSEADVGVRTFADADKLESIPRMSKAELVDSLCLFYFRDSLEQLERKQLMKLLQEKLHDDIKDAQTLRDDMVNKELVARLLPLAGNFEQRVARLREVLSQEERLCALEDSHLDELREKIGQENRLEALQSKVNQVHSDTLREELEGLDLEIDTSGTHTDLAFRHRLWKDIEWKSHVSFAGVNPELMEINQLEAEFEERKLSLRESFKKTHTEEQVRQEMIFVLKRALLEDLEKGPLKYDFGCQYIQLEDLQDLDTPTIEERLNQAGVKPGRRSSRSKMIEQLRTILVSRSHDKYLETVKQELAGLGVQYDESADFRTLFSLLESRKRELDRLQPIAELHSPSHRSPSPTLNSSPSFELPLAQTERQDMAVDDWNVDNDTDNRDDSASSLVDSARDHLEEVSNGPKRKSRAITEPQSKRTKSATRPSKPTDDPAAEPSLVPSPARRLMFSSPPKTVRRSQRLARKA